MRKGKPEKNERIGFSRSIAELVPRVGRKAFRRFGFAESAVVARWPEIVGAQFSRQCTPESIRFPHGKRSGGTLTLAAHGAFALSIQHAEPLIIERVNRFFGYAAVSRIAIRQGAAASPPPAARTDLVRPLDEGDRAALKEIEDDELRTSLEGLAARVGVTKGPPKIS